MHNIKLLILFFTLTSLEVFAESKTDIFGMYTQFAISDSVSKKCINPDSVIYGKFSNNFKLVSMSAAQEFRKMNPNFTEEQTINAMKERNNLIGAQVSKLVAAKGCNDPMLQEAAKRFHVQANWQM